MSYGEVTFNKARCLQLLRNRGITHVHMEYSGGNDEGSVDAERFTDAEGNEIKIEYSAYEDQEWDTVSQKWKRLGWFVGHGDNKRPATVEERNDAELLAQCHAPVYDKYGSFAGEFEVCGTIEIDVAAGAVVMNDSYGMTQYESTTLSF